MPTHGISYSDMAEYVSTEWYPTLTAPGMKGVDGKNCP